MSGARRFPRPRSLTLCYHAASASWDDGLSIAPAAIEQQVRFLLRGRRGGRAEDAIANARGVLHATFDDAYVSVLDVIPLLERAGVPSTVFACGDYGDGRALDVPELRGSRHHPEAMRTLTWDELRGLAERGCAIGSHTMTHPHLAGLSEAEARRELVESKEAVESEIGAPCLWLAYPYGESSELVRRLAREAGYRAAFGLPGWVGDPFDVARLGVYRRDDLKRLALKATPAGVWNSRRNSVRARYG